MNVPAHNNFNFIFVPVSVLALALRLGGRSCSFLESPVCRFVAVISFEKRYAAVRGARRRRRRAVGVGGGERERSRAVAALRATANSLGCIVCTQIAVIIQ